MTKALSRSQLPKETLSADKKACRRFGPCGVGEQALYLNSFWFERFYYVPIAAVYTRKAWDMDAQYGDFLNFAD